MPSVDSGGPSGHGVSVAGRGGGGARVAPAGRAGRVAGACWAPEDEAPPRPRTPLRPPPFPPVSPLVLAPRPPRGHDLGCWRDRRLQPLELLGMWFGQ